MSDNKHKGIKTTVYYGIMQKSTHLAFGVLIGAALFAVGLPLPIALLTGFSAFLPDLDFLLDKVWIKPESSIKSAWKKATGSHGMHRKIFHNMWTGIIWAIVIGYFSNWSIMAMGLSLLGFLSHLFLDSATYTGIYWLWPYGDLLGEKGKFYVRGPISTGSKTEERIRNATMVIGGILFGIGFIRQSSLSLSNTNITELVLVAGIFTLIGYRFMETFTKTSAKFTTIFNPRKRKTGRKSKRRPTSVDILRGYERKRNRRKKRFL